MNDEETLLNHAAGVNANYRGVSGEEGRELETGFLYGTAELVLVIVGLKENESYSDRREQIAREIDRRALKDGAPYRLTNDN